MPAAGERAARLAKMGWTLPTPPQPLGQYTTAVRAGSALILSGMLPLDFTPWTNAPAGSPAATRPLEVFGPPGLTAMTRNVIAAYGEDIRSRTSEGGSRNLAGTGGPIVNSHEVAAGEIYHDDPVTVTAFRVPHGNWEHAYGFRFRTPDKTIVISGDTAYTPEIGRQCNGCDVLSHEGGFNDDSAYFRASHTNAEELARVAAHDGGP